MFDVRAAALALYFDVWLCVFRVKLGALVLTRFKYSGAWANLTGGNGGAHTSHYSSVHGVIPQSQCFHPSCGATRLPPTDWRRARTCEMDE